MSDSSTTQPGAPQAMVDNSPESGHPSALRHRLQRLWLAIALPLSYPLFVLGSLIMVSMIPVSFLLHRTRAARTHWLRRVLYRGAGLWIRCNELLQILTVSTVDRRAPEAVAAESPYRTDSTDPPLLVIANHPSLIDVLLIFATLPDLCCVLKGALHYNPLFTLLIRHLDYLPNSDPERMLREGSKRLQAGERLLIFPEGTRSEPGKPLQFRFGAAELAVRSGAATLPVALRSNSAYLSKGHPWYRLPAGKLRYQLEIGPVLAPLRLATESVPGAAASDNRRVIRRRARRELNNRWQAHFHQRLRAPGVGN